MLARRRRKKRNLRLRGNEARVEGNREGLFAWVEANKKKKKKKERHSEWVAEWNIDHTRRALRSVSRASNVSFTLLRRSIRSFRSFPRRSLNMDEAQSHLSANRCASLKCFATPILFRFPFPLHLQLRFCLLSPRHSFLCEREAWEWAEVGRNDTTKSEILNYMWILRENTSLYISNQSFEYIAIHSYLIFGKNDIAEVWKI